MSFLDKLTQPLPSAGGAGANPADTDDNVDDDNLGDVNDPDLEEDIDNMDLDDIPESDEISPEEEAEADQIINLTATPIVLQETLGLESVRRFLESGEFDTACDEGFFMEGEREALVSSSSNLFLESGNSFMESKFYQKNTVRLTKQSKLNQLFEICVQAVARAKNDPIYFKLTKVQALRRKYKAILRKRHRGLALKKARDYLIRLRASKSPTLKKAAEELDKK